MSMRVRRIGIVAVAMAAVNVALLITEVCARHYRVQVKSLGLEPSGLYDQAGAELPFVTLRLAVPELDDAGVEFSRDPFEVECKVHDRWVQIENRASIRWSIQNEVSFLILPGTHMCRLHFKYQRETLRWRLLRTIVPQGAPYHQFPNRFWQWAWIKTPVGPKLVTLMYHRKHFSRPPHWNQMTVEIAIP
jgi:hypothetical protein